MNAAETRASSAIALWTELTVVSRSSTTAEIDTFINDVSTTSTNIAAASTSDSRVFPASPASARRRRLRQSRDGTDHATGCGDPRCSMQSSATRLPDWIAPSK